LKVADADWGATTSSPVLKQELQWYLKTPGMWSTDGRFTPALYGVGKQMLLTSGLVHSVPSYQTLTKGSPSS
jgi:hypothetical protein